MWSFQRDSGNVSGTVANTLCARLEGVHLFFFQTEFEKVFDSVANTLCSLMKGFVL